MLGAAAAALASIGIVGGKDDEIWRTRLSVLGLLGAIFFGAVLHAAAEDTQAKRHQWSMIVYPDLPSPWKSLAVSLGFGEKSEGLRFDLVLRGPGTAEKTPSGPKEGDIKVRLHRGDGQAVSPKAGSGTVEAWVGGSLGTSGDVMYVFPWGKKRSA